MTITQINSSSTSWTMMVIIDWIKKDPRIPAKANYLNKGGVWTTSVIDHDPAVEFTKTNQKKTVLQTKNGKLSNSSYET